jgi:hypothetical protein
MYKGDPRLEEVQPNGEDLVWLSRKPSKQTAQKNQIAEVLGENAVARSLLDSPGARSVAGTALATQIPRVARAIPRAVKSLGAARQVGAGIWAGSTVGGAGVVALLAAAGLGSYFGTRYIIDNFPTKDRRLAAASDAYKQAKRNAAIAAGLGRDGAAELPPEVLQTLAAHYKQVVKDINKWS